MAIDLSSSDLKIGARHIQALTPKVWVTDLSCLVPIDEYLRELSCRDLFGGGSSGTSDPYFAALKETNTGAENAALISDILDSNPTASTKIVRIPAGIFDVDDIVISFDDTIIQGSGMPDINDTLDALVGGTVLRGGKININNSKNVTIRDLGLDVSGTGGSDAIFSGTSEPGVQKVKIINVAALGNMGGHGAVLTSGDYNVIRNFKAWNFNHPFALRCSWSIVDGFYCYSKDDSVSSGGSGWTAASGGIVKSVDDGGIINAIHNIVSNGIIECEVLGAGRGFVFDAFSAGTECRYNIVSNITTSFVNFGISFGGDGICQDNSVSNCVLYRCAQNGVILQDTANQNSLTAIRTRLSGNYSFKNSGTGTQNDLFGCHSVGPGALNVDGVFRTSEVLN